MVSPERSPKLKTMRFPLFWSSGIPSHGLLMRLSCRRTQESGSRGSKTEENVYFCLGEVPRMIWEMPFLSPPVESRVWVSESEVSHWWLYAREAPRLTIGKSSREFGRASSRGCCCGEAQLWILVRHPRVCAVQRMPERLLEPQQTKNDLDSLNWL